MFLDEKGPFWNDVKTSSLECPLLLPQCSTLVDNVLSRYACKQCCDVQHVGLGCVRSCLWLATSVPLRLRSLCSGKVPDVGSSVYVFRKGSLFGFPTFVGMSFK